MGFKGAVDEKVDKFFQSVMGVYGKKGGYSIEIQEKFTSVYGVKRILSLANGEIGFEMYGFSLWLFGDDLRIYEISKASCDIVGRVDRVEMKYDK